MNLTEMLVVRSKLLESISIIEDKIIVHGWKLLADRGDKFLSMKAYRLKNKCTYTVSKEIVEKYIEYGDRPF